VWQDGGVKRQSAQFRTTRRHLTPKEKAEILKEHRRSGLSLVAFAEKRGLCYTSLLRWRCRQGNGANVPVPPDGYFQTQVQELETIRRNLEHTAYAGPDLGFARADTPAAGDFQLEESFDHRRVGAVALLLPDLG
jgi:transposase-like protein